MNFLGNDLDIDDKENEMITVPGRQGMYTMAESIHDKYNTRPIGVEDLTLSQFATCYTKCTKEPKTVSFNDFDVSDKREYIIDYMSNQNLPQYIKMSTNEISRLRRYPNVLQILSSSKKKAVTSPPFDTV